ncbi:MAG TPA: M23 family metallopeptidase [Polyangia bacterium]|nr:M23 family metallopeptidase [Polyangia bacterium]
MAGWLVASFFTLRALVLGVPVVLGFVIVTALLSHVVENERWRLAIGLFVSLGAPLILRWRIAEFLRGRKLRGTPSSGLFLAIANSIIAAIIAFGFADDTGRALRRHGDWFVGERNGLMARGYRSSVGAMAAYLEKFDPPAELAPIVIPPDPKKIPEGPWMPGEQPPESLPTTIAWFHPLAGPRRALPNNESRRFGAARPQPRPPECELGHCGVDLGSTVGEPVFAVFDGVIERIERDETKATNGADARAGRFIRIGHKDGTVVSRYIHLDTIREDLKEGDHVKAGQLIGRLGASGILNAGAHLHFSISLRDGGRAGGSERYIDPEPMLRTWALVDVTSALPANARAQLP